MALTHDDFNVCFGGARNDEENSLAKERLCSFRIRTTAGTLKQQRSDLWLLYNTQVRPGESLRVSLLSNWTSSSTSIWRISISLTSNGQRRVRCLNYTER